MAFDVSSIITVALVLGYIPLVYLGILPSDSYKEILLFVLGNYLGVKKQKQNQNQNQIPKEEIQI